VTNLVDVAGLLARVHGLCVVSTTRADGTVQSTLVNAGVLPHPQTGDDVVAFVARSGARKLANLRDRPQVTVTVHDAWEWATAEGVAEIIGPDDPSAVGDAEGLRALLRAVFSAAGGTHDDWDEFDRVMRDERRAVVLVTPTRVYSNG
jgi:PPOX class probable F420-dependent enzyme